MSWLLELKDVSVAFEVSRGVFTSRVKAKAIDRVSLQLGERQTLALVGESGCGKTTTGRVAAGLIRPTEGSVLFYGRDVWKLDRAEFRVFRRSVQIIHQDPYASLNPMLTIYRTLSAPLFNYGIVSSKREAVEYVSKLLETVGLVPPEDFIFKYPHQLSGGQRQRVVIARAISINPKCIVADEPVSMIDVSLRLQILRLMKDLQRKMGISYLFITHDLATGRYFASDGYTAVMYLGTIVEFGPTNSVILDPQHPYTRALLSAIPEPDPEKTRKKKVMQLRSLDVPSLLNIPPGCKFHPRCPFFIEGKCDKQPPPRYHLGKDRWVACYLYEGAG
ncbi:MAG: ABC transporter ATP-binding protein [Thermofilaceae archaeon]